MGKKHIALEEYIKKIPEVFRSNLEVLESFNGNRTNISFKFSCGCVVKQPLKSFLIRDQFEYCTKCKPKVSNRKSRFDNADGFVELVEGKDYVVCVVCGFHAKSLGAHVSKVHNILADEYKKNHQIICTNSKEIYSTQNKENSNWIERAKERGEDLTEYFEKMGAAVKASILANPEDRKRRAKVMSDVNKSDIMRKKSSETAIKTSARKDIQEARAEKLKKWRNENPDEFYDKCVSKMIGTWNSKPEAVLYQEMIKRTKFNFKRHQKLRSEKFLCFYKQKDIDIGDTDRRVYIEYDGPLHFKQTTLNQLDNVQEKDRLLDEHIIQHGWVLIRVGYDQFSYRKSDYGFKSECLAKIDGLLNNLVPGVHRIGDVYEQNRSV